MVKSQEASMRYETNMRVEAPAGTVWAVLADIGSWPSWTPTVTAVAVDAAEGADLAEGQRATLSQPGRRPTSYTVQKVEAGRRFQWGSAGGGVRQWADHVVEPDGADRCSVTLTFAMEGPVGRLIGRLGAGTIRRMVDTESASLKAYAEKSAGAARTE
jgi:uncharacterized membrane protein